MISIKQVFSNADMTIEAADQRLNDTRWNADQPEHPQSQAVIC